MPSFQFQNSFLDADPQSNLAGPRLAARPCCRRRQIVHIAQRHVLRQNRCFSWFQKPGFALGREN